MYHDTLVADFSNYLIVKISLLMMVLIVLMIVAGAPAI
ncbi:hypothetical protein NIES22_05580 [Calothrix brevissima NIES-22]|nr:hypothetical protein NIES22_05580 [Calothrix brevissima NIES-22]